MDPAKLKVVELRAELSQRGLDTKGNKAVLVERLRKALEEETVDSEPQETALETGGSASPDAASAESREKTPEPAKPPTNAKTPSRSARSTSVTATPKTPARGARLQPSKQQSPVRSQTDNEQSDVSPTREECSQESRDSVPEPESTVPEVEPEPAATPAPAMIPESVTTPEVTTISVPEDVTPDSTPAQSEPVEAQLVPEIQSLETNIKTPASELLGETPVDTEESVPVVERNDEPITITPDAKVEQVEEKSVENSMLRTESPVKQSNESHDAPVVEEQSTPMEVTPADDELNKLGTTDAISANDDDLESEIKPKQESVSEADSQEAELKTDGQSGLEESLSNESETKPVIKEESSVDSDKITTIQEEDRRDADLDENKIKTEDEDIEMRDPKPNDDSDAGKDRDRTDRKDRKRKRSSSPPYERQRSPGLTKTEDEPELDDDAVLLSWYDSDLNLVISKEGFLSATPMHNDGFGYVWAGARASFGVNQGKVYYETKITENCQINVTEDEHPHVLRVGWSVSKTSMQLGEEKLSYGFGGTGKISTNCKFNDYGKCFGKDDVVGCYADLTDETTVTLSYTINGEEQGVAFTVPKTELEGAALFPHILSKNCAFCCNFGSEDPWSKLTTEGYVPIASVPLKDRIPGPRRPEKKEDCEMIMMCGLPGAGKTYWANNYVIQHPEKMYNILGTNNLIEKMKVMGLPRRRNYRGRWEILIDKCTRALNKLLEVASSRRRNYILDQTNVYATAQRRKMRHFYGFQRKAVVVVPSDEEFKSRIAARDAIEGKDVPDAAVLEMKANFSLPTVGEFFESIEWTENEEEEAKKLVEKYNKEGKDAGYSQQPVNKRPRFDRADSHRDSRDSRSSRDSRDSRDHRDRRGGGYMDRSRSAGGWRGGGNNGVGWRDRPQRGGSIGGGHPRHGGSGGGYGPPSGGWRGRGGGSTASAHRSGSDRRGGGASGGTSGGSDRRTGSDRSRTPQQRQGGGWGGAMGYQSGQQHQSGGWGGQQSNWSSNQSQQGNWGQQGGWGQQQWGGWKGFGQGTYGQAGYGQQNYGNGNWGGWNQQYYNQYWGQQQQQQHSGQSTIAGGQIAPTTGATTTTTASTANTSATYGYPQGWQGYAQTYSFSGNNTNTTSSQGQQQTQQK